MSFSNTETGDKPSDLNKVKNLDEVSIKEKVEGLSVFIDGQNFCMLTTRHGSSGALVSRAMAVAGKESGGIDLIFFTNTESGKTDDLDNDPHVNVSFIDSSGQWASISGTTSILTDRDTTKKYYSSTLKAWLGDLGDGKHDGGPDDPRLGIIKVQTKTITYSIHRKNALSRGVEIAQGMVTGKAAQVNKLREISEQEVLTWRTSKKMVN